MIRPTAQDGTPPVSATWNTEDMSAHTPRFIARTAELAQLDDAVRGARDGRAVAVVIGGDAGVGKSRLVECAVAEAAETGALVVTGHCLDLGDAGLPYLPIIEALGALRENSGAASAAIAASPALTRMLDGASEGPGGDDELNRVQLFDALATTLVTVGSAEHPLVLVIEDLHWSDASTRDVLRFLMARMRAGHLCLIATYRADDLHRRHPWRQALAELHRLPRVEHLVLEPFTEPELREFTGAVTSRQLSERDHQRLFQRSEGNAFFAEELLLARAESSALTAELTDVLHARLTPLDDDALALARIASVAGRRVREPLLWAVAKESSRFSSPSVFDEALRTCLAHQVLQRDGDQLTFRHALLAETVYLDVLPGEAADLHRAYARAIREGSGLGSAAEAAHHSRLGHDNPGMLQDSHAAAREAAAVYAPAEELRHLQTVLELWRAVADAPSLVGADLVDVGIAAATAAHRAGQPTKAVALARRAVADAAPDRLRQARLGHVLAQHLGGAFMWHEAVEVTTDSLEVLDADEPSRDLAWTWATRARAAFNADLHEMAMTAADRAVAEARRAGAADAETDALITQAVLLKETDLDRASDLLQRAYDQARSAGDLVTASRAGYNLVVNRYAVGDLQRASLLAQDRLRTAREDGLGWSVYVPLLSIYGELLRYAAGDLTPPAAENEPPPPWRSSFRAVTLHGALARGEDVVPRARRLVEEEHDDTFMRPQAIAALVEALTWAGLIHEAAEIAESAVAEATAEYTDVSLSAIRLAALGLSALADMVGPPSGSDPEEVRERADRLLAHAVETSEAGELREGPLGSEAHAWLHRARAEHARVHGTDGPGLWRADLESFSYGHRVEMLRSRWRLATALVSQGEREEAGQVVETALSEARGMGHRLLERALRELARRARLRTAGVRHEISDVLTPRERDVLRLVADGLSNKKIGEQLYISPKTVSVHVSNVLAKLGVSGRTEAVSVAMRRGLLDS